MMLFMIFVSAFLPILLTGMMLRHVAKKRVVTYFILSVKKFKMEFKSL